MPPEKEQTTETTVETKETPAPSSSPPSDEGKPEGTGIEFEEPDFSSIVEFAESDSDEPAEAPAKSSGEEEEVVVEEETPPQKTPAEETKGAEEEEPKKEEKEEEVEVEVKPEEKEEAPKKEATKEEKPPEPEFKVPTKEELEGMYKEHREKTIPIFEDLFQLSEEEAAALDEQPSKVLPKLAGKMMYDVMLSSFNATMAAMPSVVNRLITVSNEANEAERAFYGEWPDLAKPELKPVVSAALRSYRGANPRATLDDVIKKAGVMAMINAGLDPTKKAKEEEVKSPAEKKTTPAKPAGARATTQTRPPKPKGSESDNLFGNLAEAWTEEMK